MRRILGVQIVIECILVRIGDVDQPTVITFGIVSVTNPSSHASPERVGQFRELVGRS